MNPMTSSPVTAHTAWSGDDDSTIDATSNDGQHDTNHLVNLQVEHVGDYAHIQVMPPQSQSPNPNGDKIHLIFVVDISGSMGSSVQSVATDGAKEDNGFSILDLVKHSLLTIVESLGGNHYVSLVSFATDARTEFVKMEMTEAGKTIARDNINNLRPTSTTNIWAGMQHAFDILVQDKQDMASDKTKLKEQPRNEIMLFTDGCPNCNPPRGHIPTIRKYMQDKEVPAHTVRTYGFGYSLDSKLLEEIATVGKGSFNFIPDAGFVGTIFIHSLASILCTVPVSDLEVHLDGCSLGRKSSGDVSASESMELTDGCSPKRGSMASGKNNQVLGLQRLTDDSASTMLARKTRVTIPLGSNLEFGQPRTIVVKNPDFSSVSVTYTDAATGAPREVKSGNVTQLDAVRDRRLYRDAKAAMKPHVLRLDACDKMHEFVAGSGKFGVESSYGNREVYNDQACEKHSLGLKKWMLEIKNKHLGDEALMTVEGDDSDYVNLIEDGNINISNLNKSKNNSSEQLSEAILQDLEGQVSEALSKAEFFNRWGVFYLRSLIFAHLHQKRNNFKDFGVQLYGGELFSKQVDRINDLFDKLPPPEPSNKNSYGGGCHVQVRSMSVYNNACGPCFSGDSLVQLVDGNSMRCDLIRPGMVVLSARLRCHMRVKCVIKTVGANMKLIRFQEDSHFRGLGVTPWHPIVDKSTNVWAFPADIAAASATAEGVKVDASNKVVKDVVHDMKTVYNFLLEGDDGEMIEDHTIRVNGVATCTLGHGIEQNDVIKHDYYGNLELVTRDLSQMAGWEDGYVTLQAETCCVKSMITGLVCAMQQITLEGSTQDSEDASLLDEDYALLEDWETSMRSGGCGLYNALMGKENGSQLRRAPTTVRS